ncbi:MAG: hypothetical protein ABW155_18465, partial [Candidatus Thiodiazotropha sp.]
DQYGIRKVNISGGELICRHNFIEDELKEIKKGYANQRYFDPQNYVGLLWINEDGNLRRDVHSIYHEEIQFFDEEYLSFDHYRAMLNAAPELFLGV